MVEAKARFLNQCYPALVVLSPSRLLVLLCLSVTSSIFFSLSLLFIAWRGILLRWRNGQSPKRYFKAKCIFKSESFARRLYFCPSFPIALKVVVCSNVDFLWICSHPPTPFAPIQCLNYIKTIQRLRQTLTDNRVSNMLQGLHRSFDSS